MRTAADLLAGKIDQMDPEARRIAVADLTGSKLFDHIAKGGFDFDPKSSDPAMVARGDIALPVAVIPKKIGDELGAPRPETSGGDPAKPRPAKGGGEPAKPSPSPIGAPAATVRLSVRDAQAIAAEHEGGARTMRWSRRYSTPARSRMAPCGRSSTAWSGRWRCGSNGTAARSMSRASTAPTLAEP